MTIFKIKAPGYLVSVIFILTVFLPSFAAGATRETSVDDNAADQASLPAKVEKPSQQETFKASKLSSVESFRNRKLLKKRISDLDAFRVVLKYIADHRNDESRLLLIEEADNYIDKYVDPLLDNPAIYDDDTFDLAISLNFFKAYVYFESGKQDEFLGIIKAMEKKYGNKHLNIRVSSFNEPSRTIGEVINLLKGMIL